MKDKNGVEIKVGQTLERVVEGRASHVGMEYTVISKKWNDDSEVVSLVADGGYIKELLDEERAKEFIAK